MEKEIAERILNETEVGYDLISKKFSETRKHFWRGLEFIRDFCAEKDNVLDYGCGNGRLLELLDFKDINYWGLDVSEKLIEIAKEKYQNKQAIAFDKINPSSTTLAFNDKFFNTIYSIAVFHHFPSKKYREDVARELYRATKDDGHIVVTVWYLWQQKYFKNILQNWVNKIKGNSTLDWNDCSISFTDNSGTRVERFHHAFTKRELKKLFEQAGFKTEKCAVVDGRNILYIGKK
ncbi:MAG: methyltransferase domain-containing protein [Candidatus Moranbacteria bacterium]|nr:methyltransferase domain-containing protein [Candidatus Moranbacteria bacterium]